MQYIFCGGHFTWSSMWWKWPGCKWTRWSDSKEAQTFLVTIHKHIKVRIFYHFKTTTAAQYVSFVFSGEILLWIDNKVLDHFSAAFNLFHSTQTFEETFLFFKKLPAAEAHPNDLIFGLDYLQIYVVHYKYFEKKTINKENELLASVTVPPSLWRRIKKNCFLWVHLPCCKRIRIVFFEFISLVAK